MKQTTYSPYATNKGGRILSPKGTVKDGPKSVRITGDDLRQKSTKKGS